MKNTNTKYRLLQSSYWMLFCVGYGYVTFYLQAHGYTAGRIGLITAVFGTLAAILQPQIGRLADRGGRWGWKPLLAAMAAACLAVSAALFVAPGAAAQGILFGAFLMCISVTMPLVNTASFYYNAKGAAVDFGVARGLGSLCYAGISLLLGRITAALGARAVPVAGVAVAALLLCTALWMPYEAAPVRDACGDGTGEVDGGSTATQKNPSHGSFFARYPAFTRMLIGSVLMLAFHNITNTYLISLLEHVGGDSGSMGVALAIAAVMELPVMFGFSRIVKRIPAGKLLVIAGCAYAVKGIVYLAAGSVWMIYAAQFLQMLSFALYASASVYYAEECMAPADKAEGQAWMSCTITVGAVIGNLLGGWVLDMGGVAAMLWLATALAAAGTVTAVTALKKS